MAWRAHSRSAEQSAALRRAARRAEAAGQGIAVLDLDGCLFDNRPRQLGILRAWAASAGQTDALAALSGGALYGLGSPGHLTPGGNPKTLD
ncbi:MAG: hypothetical protein IPI35_08860 [Deltaproteobacteria bacterium]|nr:hypothetical protein [Deltaproteobacteria bacterium]